MLPGTCSPSEPVLYLAHLNSDLPFYILPVMLKLELCKFPFPDSFVTWPPCHVLPKEGSEADWKMEGGKKILLVFFLGGGGSHQHDPSNSSWLQLPSSFYATRTSPTISEIPAADRWDPLLRVREPIPQDLSCTPRFW